MRNTLALSCLVLLLTIIASCERKPYVEHKLKIENTGKDCSQLEQKLGLNSNFGGERYEFQKCLQTDFTTEQVSTSRKGDTVIVSFNKNGQGAEKVFQLTLDIDSYPAYHFLTIDEETYTIAPTTNK